MEYFHLAISRFRRYYRLREPLDPLRYLRCFHPYFKSSQITLHIACMIFFSSRNVVHEALPTPFMVIVSGENIVTFLLNLQTIMTGLFLENRVKKITCQELFHFALGALLYFGNFYLAASYTTSRNSNDLNKIISQLFGNKSTLIDFLTAYPTFNLVMQIMVLVSVKYEIQKLDENSPVPLRDIEADRETSNSNHGNLDRETNNSNPGNLDRETNNHNTSTLDGEASNSHPDDLEPSNDQGRSDNNHEVLAFKAKRQKLQVEQQKKQKKQFKNPLKKKQRSKLQKKVQFNSKPELIDAASEQESLLDDEPDQISNDNPDGEQNEGRSVESNDDYLLLEENDDYEDDDDEDYDDNDDDDDGNDDNYHDSENNYNAYPSVEGADDNNLLEGREVGAELQITERNSDVLSLKRKFDDGCNLVKENRKEGNEELNPSLKEKDESEIPYIDEEEEEEIEPDKQ